mgnify:FL=1
MSRDAYFEMCEALGSEPIESQMPVDEEDLCIEAHQAFEVASFLPDRYEGMSGMYFGKDMGGIGEILSVLEIQDRYHVLLFLRVIINEKMAQSAEQQKSKSKSTPGMP